MQDSSMQDGSMQSSSMKNGSMQDDSFMYKHPVCYGIDVGGTKIEFAIFNKDFKPILSWRVATPKQDYQLFLSTIQQMVSQADQTVKNYNKQNNDKRSHSIGIGLPCVIDQEGKVSAANIPCLNGQFLKADITQLLNRSVVFENDAKAFLISEINGGAADGKRIALGISLGTGIAGGLSIAGELYQGKQNIAGEFGHLLLPAILQQRYNLPLRECGCGMTSCIEQYISGPGLLWLCCHFNSQYQSIDDFVYGLAHKESKAEEIFKAYIGCLACYFAQLTLIYDPNIIVVGGGLSNIQEIYTQVAKRINHYLPQGISSPEIAITKFGDSSSVRGAAIIGYQYKPNQS